ncbi:MAG TPA: penicillin-binding protein 2, partial [Alphaproteobacteria bacterium]|nr:penicillin-binding protein 2 [Alphaproteobacteria bacterium]
MSDGLDSVRYRAFTRRTLVLGGGMAGLFMMLTGRMVQLSVFQRDQYKSLADENRINMQLLAPPRGRIFDRNGVELAGNQLNYRVLMTPEQAEDPHKILDLIAQLTPLSEKQRARILRDIKRAGPFKPILVAEGLSWDDFARINVNIPSLPGVAAVAADIRSYPNGAELGHVLGYVGGVTEKDIQADPQLISLPGFRLGRSGIERFADARLRGQPGAVQLEVDSRGRILRELSRRPGTPGEDLVLTIDQGLQKFTQERLWGESASAVVMDVHTGDVLALVSAPGFDPNNFLTGPSPEVWKALTTDPLKPLLNKVIGGVYPPGSTFKPVTAFAALESQAMTPQDRVYCDGSTRIGRQVFHCWARGGHGSVDMETALKVSCDVYFYECGRRMGIGPIETMARRFGFGQVYGLEVPGQKAGLVPNPDWKLKHRKQKWTEGETFNVSIGQGALQTTPLQLCVMTARIANGGMDVSPRLMRPEHGPGLDTHVTQSALVAAEHMAIIRAGMEAVTGQGGTASRSQLKLDGYEMAGKTGTAQV